eukprot:753915-Hanusia_phi.AAC.18
MPRRLDPDSRALPRSDGSTLHFATNEGMKSRPTQDDFLLTASHILKCPHNYNPVHAHNTRYKRWYSSTFTEPKRQGCEMSRWFNGTVVIILFLLCFGLAFVVRGLGAAILPIGFIPSEYKNLQELHGAVQNLQQEQKNLNQEIESLLRYKINIENTSQRLASILAYLDEGSGTRHSVVNQTTVFHDEIRNFSTSIVTEIDEIIDKLNAQVEWNATEKTGKSESMQHDISELSKMMLLYQKQKADFESAIDAQPESIHSVSEILDLKYVQKSFQDAIESFVRNASKSRFFDEVKNEVILQSVKEISRKERILTQKTMDEMSYDRLIPARILNVIPKFVTSNTIFRRSQPLKHYAISTEIEFRVWTGCYQ